MADDWRVGDLALCVDADGEPKDFGEYRECSYNSLKGLVAGRVYTVLAIVLAKDGGNRIGLKVAPGTGGLSTRFRKIRPLSDEERDSFMADLRLPQTVEA